MQWRKVEEKKHGPEPLEDKRRVRANYTDSREIKTSIFNGQFG